MADVTDMAFRQIIVSCGKPDVFYTEFVSVDGLCYALKNSGSKILEIQAKLMPHLKFKENERPIVAQFFGSKPENFYKCAQLAVKLGFDGIDINMGCPAGKIVKNDSGAGLILNPELAKEIIRKTKKGSGDLPVSVKTRIGYNKIITEKWISNLIEAKPSAIIVHGRTMKEMSKVPAHWDEIGKAAVLCQKAGISIIGNGDVASHEEGIKKAKQNGLDGIMVGRGIFSNPWFFSVGDGSAFGGNGSFKKTPNERIELLKNHVDFFIELWGNQKNFNTLKKFFKIYVSGWNGAKELRIGLMQAKNKKDVFEILNKNNYN